MRELFVWYRVRDEHDRQVRAAVLAMQRSLAASWPGLQARLLVRRGSDSQTWMETYARPPHRPGDAGGIDGAIEAAGAASAQPWAGLVDGIRHVEAFEPAGDR